MPGTFHIWQNNCTTVAIAAADSANVPVPKEIDEAPIIDDTGKKILHFKGYSPRKLGQGLRATGGTIGQF